MSADVGFGVTVTLSFLEGPWSDVLSYKSADKDDTYTYTTTLEFFDDGLNYDEETGNDV